MKILVYNVPGAERKRLARTIAELCGFCAELPSPDGCWTLPGRKKGNSNTLCPQERAGES